jgi:hypothetical protein
MLDLHLWNEHIPRMPRRGATIGWAQKMHTAMVLSLQELAHFLAQRSDLEEIAILCVNTMFTSSRRTDQTVRLMRCYGFEPAGGANLQLQPEHRP